MEDKLIVKSFGPIDYAELDIKKTTVMIGPQGSGKSTLAKLVAMFCDKMFFANLGLQPYKNDFPNYNISDFFGDKTALEFKNNNYQILYVEKKFIPLLNPFFNNLTKQKMTEQMSNLEMGFNEFAGFLKQKTVGEGRGILGTIGSPVYSTAISNFLFQNTLYIPAERFLISSTSGATWGLIDNNIALAKYITQFGSKFEIARQTLSKLLINYLDIVYKYENGLDKVILKNGKEIKLSVSASGYQSIVPLQLVIENNYQNDLTKFIIEEPELNLFPTTQKQLIQYLADRCTQNKNELLITTHSPYILSSLNLLIFAYQVAQKHPEQVEAIKAIIPQESWINPAEFAAYYVSDGTARSIINPKTGLISDNELDGVSDLISDDFDALMEIYRMFPHEKAA